MATNFSTVAERFMALTKSAEIGLVKALNACVKEVKVLIDGKTAHESLRLWESVEKDIATRLKAETYKRRHSVLDKIRKPVRGYLRYQTNSVTFPASYDLLVKKSKELYDKYEANEIPGFGRFDTKTGTFKRDTALTKSEAAEIAAAKEAEYLAANPDKVKSTSDDQDNHAPPKGGDDQPTITVVPEVKQDTAPVVKMGKHEKALFELLDGLPAESREIACEQMLLILREQAEAVAAG